MFRFGHEVNVEIENGKRPFCNFVVFFRKSPASERSRPRPGLKKRTKKEEEECRRRALEDATEDLG